MCTNNSLSRNPLGNNYEVNTKSAVNEASFRRKSYLTFFDNFLKFLYFLANECRASQSVALWRISRNFTLGFSCMTLIICFEARISLGSIYHNIQQPKLTYWHCESIATFFGILSFWQHISLVILPAPNIKWEHF